ncbi:GntR family transcriptional regulator [Sphingomonas sp. RB3P16]|uniref:GntR family transcriptional regulator n=1 Tax=Parasphingomonas frigoris TaxID=3096163 RepID=UPI002FC62F33
MRKKDLVKDELLKRLLSGRYRFGDPISVKAFSQETGISRQPIMTALAGLSADGFVTVVAQVGCEVVSPGEDDIGDFYLMFERLEGLMAELAAKRCGTDQLRRLRAINHEISLIDADEADAAVAYRNLNRAFHELIHDMARSPILFERQTNMFAMSDFFIVQTAGFTQHIKGAAIEHEEIIRAIADRDCDRARNAAEHHIRAVGDYVRKGFARSSC